MKEQSVWFVFLEAGAKSSPVVRDETLDTNKSSTMYLFNHNRREFVEYTREIVEPKLRDFSAEEEANYRKELESTFKKARKSFKGKGSVNLAKSAAPAPPPKKEPVEEVVDVGDDDDVFDSDDWDGDDE